MGRFLSLWVAERFEYGRFTLTCIALSFLALTSALLVPWFPVEAVLFGLTGLFFGPIYPMIMALGGNLYPHRLAALSGSLAAAAVVGSVVYPPLMGAMESRIGLRGGMFGAALLCIPMSMGIVVAMRTSSRAAARSTDAETALSG